MNLKLGLPRRQGGAGEGYAATDAAVFIDPSNLATMFQERTGASATTASGVGDPVGSMQNLGTLGDWFTADTDAGRPALQQDGNGNYYLDFDGVDDSLVYAGSVTLDAVWSFVGGVRSDQSGRYLFAIGTQAGKTALRDVSGTWRWRSEADSDTTIMTGAPSTLHVASLVQASDVSLTGYYNGGGSISIDPFDSPNNGGLRIASLRTQNTSTPFQGRVYGGVWDATALADADREALETFFTGKITV